MSERPTPMGPNSGSSFWPLGGRGAVLPVGHAQALARSRRQADLFIHSFFKDGRGCGRLAGCIAHASPVRDACLRE